MPCTPPPGKFDDEHRNTSRNGVAHGVRPKRGRARSCTRANIALRTKQYLLWDAEKEQFTNNDAANAYLAAEYRKGYEWPKT